MKPQNLPEAVIWYYTICGYVIFFLGAQSVLTLLLGLFLLAYLVIKWWNQGSEKNLENKIKIPLTTWIWIFAILGIALTIVIGGIDFRYGMSEIVKSLLSQGWLRVWALIAFFILAGSLNIRPNLLSRAICILCVQSLILIPLICVATNVLNFPDFLYTTPLKVFKGNLGVYDIRISYGEYGFFPGIERLILFAPWPTPFGFLANIYFFIVTQESNKKLRFLSIVALLSMIALSGSRLALLCLIVSLLIVWFLTSLALPWLHLAIGVCVYLGSIWANVLTNYLSSFYAQFNNLRPGAQYSTNARNLMVRVGIERWKNEAPIWGHTPMLQNNMPKPLVSLPIGSHHTWVGLLFDHGFVGCFAIAIAMIWSFFDLLIKAQTSEYAKAGLGILITLTVFSFGEPISTYAYLLWPGFLFLGIVFQNNTKKSRAKSFIEDDFHIT